MATSTSGQRVKVETVFGTNLFFQMKLKEWKHEAEQQNPPSDQRHTFGMALKAVKAYQLELHSGQEAEILKGVGPHIGKRLQNALVVYRQTNGQLNPTVAQVRRLMRGTGSATHQPFKPFISQKACKRIANEKRKSKEAAAAAEATATQVATPRFFDRIRPPNRSDDDHSNNVSGPKSTSNESTNVDSYQYDDGTEIPPLKKRPQKFGKWASDVGPTTSSNAESSSCRVGQAQPLPVKLTRIRSNVVFTPFTLPVDSFDIVLLVDTQEDIKFHEIIKDVSGVECQVRRLKLGDYMWVARPRLASGATATAVGNRELVLDCIVERKRLDDLGHSITSDRYHDQKARLRNCGLSRRIYLVEYWKKDWYGVQTSALHQAVADTQLQEGFYVKWTNSAKETAKYLTLLTTKLKQKYVGKELVAAPMAQLEQTRSGNTTTLEYLPTFDEFSEYTQKSPPMTLNELFVQQLMVIPRMTGEKATAIATKFGSFSSLLTAYRGCIDGRQRDELLTNLETSTDDCEQQMMFGKTAYSIGGTKIGNALSKSVAQFFCGQR